MGQGVSWVHFEPKFFRSYTKKIPGKRNFLQKKRLKNSEIVKKRPKMTEKIKFPKGSDGSIVPSFSP